MAKSEIVDAFEKRRACYEKAKLVYAALKRKSSWLNVPWTVLQLMGAVARRLA